jgi:hypothetical protein
MARMHPEDIDDLENAMVGEKKGFRFAEKRPGKIRIL